MSSQQELLVEMENKDPNELTKVDLNTQKRINETRKIPRKFKTILFFVATLIIVVLLVVLLSLAVVDNRPGDPMARAVWLLERYPLIDGHNDLPWALRALVKNNLSYISQVDLQELSTLHTDLTKLSIGRLAGQFWSVYTPCGPELDPTAIQSTMEATDILFQIVKKYSTRFELVVTAKDVRETFRRHKIASLIGIEGGHSINNSLSVLRVFRRLGARYMTLTHACNTAWAQNCYDNSSSSDGHIVGLTEFGKNVVREMNRLGILVDLSHVSPQTMHDALDSTVAPVIFSHSSVKSLANHPRNVPDDVLQRVKTNGGVVAVNFYPLFICPPVMDRMNYYLSLQFSEAEAMQLLRDWFLKNTSVCTVKDVVKHIVYIKNFIGIDHVALGSDFDGISLVPEGLENVSKYPNLVAELIKEGFSDDDIIKVIGENFLRVLEKAENVAQN